MHYSPLLAPIVTLVAWTLVMLVWLAVKRAPFVRDRDAIPAGARGQDIPAGPHNWPAHNYTHLMEQPTLFYAIVLVLVAMGFDAPINVGLAWAYVVLRIIHSLIQSTVNIVKYRFLVFGLSTLCLLGLTVHAGVRLILG
jgi:hypothetical protein